MNHRVQKFTADGTFITEWGGLGSGNGRFDAPTGIAVDAAGNVYVGDGQHNRVQKFSLQPQVEALPGMNAAPTDPDGDGLHEDLNGNGRADFADVTLFFTQMEWIADHEPVPAFDVNGNGRIDYNDIVKLFEEL